jgi:hypothetical protein
MAKQPESKHPWGVKHPHSGKRRLSQQEEFEIMKLVLDKFLWLGTLVAAFGLYVSFAEGFSQGLVYIAAGFIFFLLFGWIIIKEFEAIR